MGQIVYLVLVQLEIHALAVARLVTEIFYYGYFAILLHNMYYYNIKCHVLLDILTRAEGKGYKSSTTRRQML